MGFGIDSRPDPEEDREIRASDSNLMVLSVGRFDVYKLFIVEPGLNPVRCNAQANAIPFVVLK